MPVGSFITSPVGTPEELAQLVERDNIVAQRYCAHFGMDALELADYFCQHLSVQKLNESCEFTVYYVTPSGRIVPHKKILRAGTKVFVTWTGQCVMDVKCGNPVVKQLPKKLATKPPVLEPANPTLVASAAPIAPETTLQASTFAPALTEEAVLVPPPVEIVAAAPISITQLIIPTLLAGAVGMLHSSGGTPVPEPTGLIVFAVGSIGLVAQLSKRRRGR